MTCTEEGCVESTVGRGLCRQHYGRLYRAGGVPPVGERHRLTAIDTGNRSAMCSVCGPTSIRLRVGRVHECMAVRAKTHKGGKQTAEARRRQQYKMSATALEELLAKQGGGCAICGAVGRLVVDHDHACCPVKSKSCGRCVRGLLCRTCNLGLGYFRDTPSLLRAAQAYLG